MVSCATMAAGLSVSIVNRKSLSVIFDRGHRIAKLMSPEAAIKQIETDLRTTSGSISLILSIFIVVQGVMPLLWTVISEIKGRKVRIYFIRHLMYLLTEKLSGCVASSSLPSSSLLRSLWWDV